MTPPYFLLLSDERCSINIRMKLKRNLFATYIKAEIRKAMIQDA